MGVRVLVRTKSEPLATIEARLEALGARPIGRWRAACSYMLPRDAETGLHEIFDVQASEGSGERYLVVRERSASACICACAARGRSACVCSAWACAKFFAAASMDGYVGWRLPSLYGVLGVMPYSAVTTSERARGSPRRSFAF